MRFFIAMLMFAQLFGSELIFYCGITMRKAMDEMVKKFENKNPSVKIVIVPGSSKGLLQTIKKTKKGDLYLPGSESYILQNRNLFLKYKQIGYNQLAIIVKKGNPLHITSIDDLINPKYRVVLCNYKFSSCGKESKRILKKYKIFEKTVDNSVEIAMDSKPVNELVKNDADVALNWKASAVWDNNKKYLQVVDINAKKHKLLLAVVKYTKNPQAAYQFLDFAVSKEGKKIMKKYGFLE